MLGVNENQQSLRELIVLKRELKEIGGGYVLVRIGKNQSDTFLYVQEKGRVLEKGREAKNKGGEPRGGLIFCRLLILPNSGKGEANLQLIIYV